MTITDEQILEGNKLIAEFMGYTYFPNDSINGILGVLRKDECMPMHLDLSKEFHAKYHSSWDWIMSVAEMIGRLSNWNFSFNISQSYPAEAIIFDNDYKHTAAGIRLSRKSYNPIESIWLVVVEFIKYWNSEKAK